MKYWHGVSEEVDDGSGGNDKDDDVTYLMTFPTSTLVILRDGSLFLDIVMS